MGDIIVVPMQYIMHQKNIIFKQLFFQKLRTKLGLKVKSYKLHNKALRGIRNC